MIATMPETAFKEDSLLKHFFLASLLAGAIALPAAAADYTIIAPANPGGGWDQTARSLQTVLQEEGISKERAGSKRSRRRRHHRSCAVRKPAEGQRQRADRRRLRQVGAILTKQGARYADDVTPIARLTGEI